MLDYFIERDLGTILKCCSLDSSLKILSCGFFLIDGSVFFKKIKYSHDRILKGELKK